MDISAEIAAIQAASQGSELRQPLVGALNKLNTGSLPAVTASDVGKILKVGANGWEVGEKSGYMPVPTATKQITENDTYDVTDFASAIVNVSGGVGVNILSGTDAPTSVLGTNGIIYIQYNDVPPASYISGGSALNNLLVDPNYLVSSTSQLLSTQSAAFYKTVDGNALAVHFKANDASFYGPLLISTVEDYVKITRNTGTMRSAIIDGITWYLTTTNYWNTNADSPSIPTMYNVLSGNSDPAEIIEKILEIATVSSPYLINAAYLKVNGSWEPLIGSNINDVNTGD